jgi:hypothetical protein
MAIRSPLNSLIIPKNVNRVAAAIMLFETAEDAENAKNLLYPISATSAVQNNEDPVLSHRIELNSHRSTQIHTDSHRYTQDAFHSICVHRRPSMAQDRNVVGHFCSLSFARPDGA